MRENADGEIPRSRIHSYLDPYVSVTNSYRKKIIQAYSSPELLRRILTGRGGRQQPSIDQLAGYEKGILSFGAHNK